MKKGRKGSAAAAVLLGVALLLCLAAGLDVYHATVDAVNEARRPLAVKRDMLHRMGFDADALERQYHAETVQIPSAQGDYTIPANYLTADGNKARDTVVMAHGLNGNRLTAYPVAEMLLRNGFNVLTYDQRASGENRAKYMTCGYLESFDFEDCVNYVRKEAGRDAEIGAWGSSIGGATVGLYLSHPGADGELSFALLDCPVSSMRDIVRFLDRNRMKRLPMGFKLTMGDFVMRMRLGFSFEDGDVCKAAADTSVPVLVMNSRADRVTPYYMGVDLYRAMKNNRKELWTVRDSKHTDLYFDYPAQYEKKIMGFIEEALQGS